MKVSIRGQMEILGVEVVSEQLQDIKEGFIAELMVRCTSAVRPSV